jgi:hypothetical protein
MKFAAISLLAGSAAAFMPVQQSGRAVVSLNAERSKALPFMNRPPLVSLFVVAQNGGHHLNLRRLSLGRLVWGCMRWTDARYHAVHSGTLSPKRCDVPIWHQMLASYPVLIGCELLTTCFSRIHSA